MSIVFIIFAIISNVSSQFNQQNDNTWRFNRCPKLCTCLLSHHSENYQIPLRTVDCSHRKLSSFPLPEHIPSDVQVLQLANNEIDHFPSNLRMWLPELIELNMNNNQLTKLPENGQFDGIYNLKRFELSGNKLKKIKDNVFRGLSKLEQLDLSHNSLQIVSKDAFNGLAKLESLILSDNRISFIRRHWWMSIPTLYNLYMDRNHVGHLSARSFSPLDRLINLDLSQNDIFRIDRNAFEKLTMLENLQMTDNSMKRIPTETLKHLKKSLKSVNFGRNPIEKLHKGDFVGMNVLKDISLVSMQKLKLVENGAFEDLPQLLIVQIHDCPYLVYIDDQAFVNIPKMSQLLLHNNNLTVFDKNTINSLPAMERISFYGNPLSCDCNVRWLRIIVDERPSMFRESERMVCNWPPEHKFKVFISLKADNMLHQCPPEIVPLFEAEKVGKMGETVELDCRAIGVPKPRISWIRSDGHAMITENDHSLVFRHLSNGDQGVYTCLAESEEGHAAVQMQLTVKTNDAVKLVVLGTETTSATIRWQGIDETGRIFQLVYRDMSRPDGHLQYAGTATPIITNLTIKQLLPGTHYQVCLDDYPTCVHFQTNESTFDKWVTRRTTVIFGAIVCLVIVILVINKRIQVGGRDFLTAYYCGTVVDLESMQNGLEILTNQFDIDCQDRKMGLIRAQNNIYHNGLSIKVPFV